MLTVTTENSRATDAHNLGFDPGALREKYRQERDKRLRWGWQPTILGDGRRLR